MLRKSVCMISAFLPFHTENSGNVHTLLTVEPLVYNNVRKKRVSLPEPISMVA